MKCKYCNEKEATGYIKDKEACEDCIDNYIESLDVHRLTKKYLKDTNRKI